MTSGEIVTIIAAVGLVLTQVITAWRTGVQVEGLRAITGHNADVAEAKLDTIHALTNSNLAAATVALAAAEARIARLEQEALATFAPPAPPSDR